MQSEGHLIDETFVWGPHSKMKLQPNSGVKKSLLSEQEASAAVSLTLS